MLDIQECAFNFGAFFSVLPSFEVKLTPESTFFHVNNNELIINIKAMYVQVFVLWIYTPGLISRFIGGERKEWSSEVVLGFLLL